MKRLLQSAVASLIGLTLVGQAARGGEIGWIEDYALSTDRAALLKQLIPGSEDYYFYYCLHYQANEQWTKADELLKQWVARYNWTPRAIEIQNRQALLTYAANHKQALDLIRQRLNLQFNHAQEQLNPKSNLPTKLDPATLSAERLNQQAFNQFPNTVQGFEDDALDLLIGAELNGDQRRHLISRLQRPDHAGLVKMIVADLNYQNSGGFGQFEIHRRLTLAQLDELLKLKPDLLNQGNFVNAYLVRLQPSNDVNWRQDRAAMRAYLERQWAFVQTLGPVHNSLKANVLYHWLVLDRLEGKYNAERFMEYIKLPKYTVYIQPKFMEPLERRQYPANLQQDFSGITLLPIVGDDDPLVRSYLQHFLLDATDYDAHLPYINDQYLKRVFAETKIVNGVGSGEKLYSLLTPEEYQQLKERVDLDFAFTNRTELDPDDPVALDLFVKNVDTLIVKVFEINTQNYYRENLHEIGPDINLDGLVANSEKTYTYKEPALRRVRRHFEFPSLDHRGVYVIDFIGNGKASRALVRKGKLQFLVRTGAAGQVFTILNEHNKPVPQATLWLAGTLYTPDKSDTIVTPFSNQPAAQTIVLSDGKFSSLAHFNQEAEEYRLLAEMYVDREELIARRSAQLIVRPQLSLNGVPVSRKLLEDVRLIITSTDLDNVASTKEVPDFKLHEDRETVYDFQVPQRLARLQFTLKAKVQNQSRNQKIDLSAEQSFALNEIDRSDKTQDMHFAKIDGNYVIDLLGKTGEAKGERAIQLQFKMRNYTQPVYASLQSDGHGRMILGPLAGVNTVTATDPQGVQHTWTIRHDEHTYPQTLNGAEGVALEVPYMGTAEKPSRFEVSLLELRGDQFFADRFENLSIKHGMYVIDKLPVGDYSLLLKPEHVHIHVRITAGVERDRYVLGDYRKLELRNEHPLQIRLAETTADTVKFQLDNVSPYARVHVFATRFEPAYDAYSHLQRVAYPEPYVLSVPKPESQYVAGRNIGDEYRYIIDRKFAHKYPGNMLERPSLLLNPWAIRSTETVQQEAQAGEAFNGPAADGQGFMHKADEKVPSSSLPQANFADLDFLAHSSIVAANVVPDKDGSVEIKRPKLGPHQQLFVVAVDPQNTVSRIVTLPEAESNYLDLRLAKSLDEKQHFTQQKLVTFVPAKGTLTIPDIVSSRFEVYDNIGRVYSLYAALNNDPKLAEFSFIRLWNKLKPDEKRTLYRKYASHELHFFLYKKDPDFFKTVLKPYLANKKEKQFLDDWQLGDDLGDFGKSWRFEQLNTFERVLLGQRVEAEHKSIARLVAEQFQLLPPDQDRFNHLFDTALKGSSLDTGDRFGMEDKLKQLQPERKLEEGLAIEEKKAMEMPAAPAPVSMAASPPPGAAKQADMPESRARAFGGKGDYSKREQSELFRRGADKSGALRDEAAKDAKEMDQLSDDRGRRAAVLQYYRKLDKTMEWVESNYYHLPLEQQVPGLITANSFWRDYAAADPTQPFDSTNLAEPTHNFPEMLMALALTDLPFEAGEHKTEFKGSQMTFIAGSPAIVYHEEIQPAKKVAEHTPILVSQNFFRNGDRYRQENGEQVDKFVSDEFLVDTVYGCQIVVTNPTSSKKKVDVLLQVPSGAMPVSNGQYTRSVHIDLEPYHTQTLEYYFYFPGPGKYSHYPVQVAGNGEVLAFATPLEFNVVRQLTKIDKQSWDYISQFGSEDDVMSYLKTENVLRINLDRIAWRMHDKAFFNKVIELLAARHIYNNTLWSYGVYHDDAPAIRQFLQFATDFVNQCGAWLDSPLLTIDPIVRHSYEHMDYRPLVNARVMQLGRKREILNDRFLAHYQELLRILSYRPKLDSAEWMAVTYYLLLQDRVEESLDSYGRVKPKDLATRLQYDYFTAYLDFYKAEPKAAREIAAKYADYPVERWRDAFANIVNQADEIEKEEAAKVADKEDRTQVQGAQAATTPSLDFTIDARQVKLNYQNLSEVQVNYYQMDIELLFSRNPFVQGDSRQFSQILPNESGVVKLPGKGGKFSFPLPEKLANSNLLVEINGGGETKSQAYFSNALRVRTIENYGQVRVLDEKDSKPLPKVYVKVYARMKDGAVRFYKDGYTDLRGFFDYTSLSTNELDFVDKFSILVLSEDHGAVVREANPPKR